MPSNPEYDSLEDVLKKVSLAKYIEHNWQPLKKIGSESVSYTHLTLPTNREV